MRAATLLLAWVWEDAMALDIFSLQGRVALVTGGNGGLGRAIALGLQEAGARVAVTGRDPTKNAAVGAELSDPSLVFSLDVRDEEAVRMAVAQVVERCGGLDILVNNAGVVRDQPVLALSRADWDAVVETNLTGMFLCAKHAAAAMVVRGRGGKIVNIGSIYSTFGTPSFSAYGAAKAGVLGLTRALAIELAVHGIQANAILPGWYETDLTRGMPTTPLGEEIRRRTPAGRWGEGNDLVGTAVFLASAASDFVTGTQLVVDGGYSVAERFVRE
jgi:2-deoxy-D-gluconate 3-dehydrogenase